MRELFSLPVTNEPASTQLNRAAHVMRAGWTGDFGKAIVGVPHALRKEYRETIAKQQDGHGARLNLAGELTFCGMPVLSHDDITDRIVVLSNTAVAKTSWPQRGSAQMPSVRTGKLTPQVSPRLSLGDDAPAPPPRRTGWETA